MLTYIFFHLACHTYADNKVLLCSFNAEKKFEPIVLTGTVEGALILIHVLLRHVVSCPVIYLFISIVHKSYFCFPALILNLTIFLLPPCELTHHIT